jgi:uncharacterized protein (TIGR02147 family)
VAAAPEVFDFIDYSEFLKVRAGLHLARRERPESIESWAKRLGYRSAQTVSMVLSGERLPSRELLERLAGDLRLSAKERRYLELLVGLERAKRKGERLAPLLEEIERLNPRTAERVPVDAATFAFISEWYHLVIKQLVGTAHFQEDAGWIRQRLRRKVTTAEASAALATMRRLGMIALDESGRLQVTGQGLQTTQDVADGAIRQHLRQMLLRAVEALDEQEPAEREVTALTLRCDPKRLPEAKAAIRQFKDEFDRRFEDLGAGDVYQLNIQFFRHTQGVPS